jgi:hypothetical protein
MSRHRVFLVVDREITANHPLEGPREEFTAMIVD